MKSSALLLSSFACCLLPSVSRAALTASYSFNETSGNTAADSVRGPAGAGTLSNFGGSQWVPGVYGNAVEFDGSNDFILALNAVPTGTTAFSVAAWVWADSAPVWGTIVKNWGGGATGAFHFGMNGGSGQMSNYLSAPFAGPVLDPAVLPLGGWHHVALTYNGGSATQTLYIDGIPVATSGAPADLDAIGPNMGIGVKTDDSTLVPDGFNPGYWDGKIDELMFWNHTLTPAEVGAAMVPEPASAAFLALGALGLLRRRR